LRQAAAAVLALLAAATLIADDAKWKDPDITWAVIGRFDIEQDTPGNEHPFTTSHREVCIDAGLTDAQWMTLAKEKLGSRLAKRPTAKELRSHASEIHGGVAIFDFKAPMAVPETLVVLHETGVRSVTFKQLRGQLVADQPEIHTNQPPYAQGVACAQIPESVRPSFAVRGTTTLIDIAKIVTDDSDPQHPQFTLEWYGHHHRLTRAEVGGEKAKAAKIFRLGNGRRVAMLFWESGDCDAAYTLLELRGANAKLILESNWDCDT
jgi:hypothetical protein